MSFHDELEWINSFLRDADEKRRINKRVDVWVSQIKNLAYDAEDIIDLFIFEVQLQRQRNFLQRCICSPIHIFTLHKFVKQIDDVNTRIKNISANKKSLFFKFFFKRVLLTTRNWDVAKHADPSSVPHELKSLGENEAFELFSNKVFQFEERSDEGSSFHEGLEELGKRLVAKCNGLPLAIVVLGGLLSIKEKTPSVWSRVLESVSWQLSEGPDQCMEILALSYTNLPYYLQSCFLYFGLFPEDHEIESTKLIQFWVAEGFIQQRGDQTMEDITEEYLEELIQRSLIQAARRRSNGGVKTCRIHDLLWDLAISEAKKDKLLEIYGHNYSTSLNRFRRLTIHSNSDDGLRHVTTLQELNIYLMTTKFEARVKKETGEDWEKIKHIPSVTV
ncbi:hypothetical protein NE237_001759 [Protea cynaroides]|uniref:Uncharacterized protein n=1 Tax=Protea cynaroides TaxID=273540 RepID=A0A9Q0KTQ3_9MAGN|nr:hypothetical protein NE237_001759 [Protea cynaroides]